MTDWARGSAWGKRKQDGGSLALGWWWLGGEFELCGWVGPGGGGLWVCEARWLERARKGSKGESDVGGVLLLLSLE